jgi:hypothetical protein
VTDNRHLRIVEKSPWNKPEAYRPDCLEMLRHRKPPSWFALLAADFSDIISEVRGSPYSHALVALLTVVAWTAVLVLPLLIGGAS